MSIWDSNRVDLSTYMDSKVFIRLESDEFVSLLFNDLVSIAGSRHLKTSSQIRTKQRDTQGREYLIQLVIRITNNQVM